MSNKITFKVVGDRTIHCTGCENTINFTLSQMPGIDLVNADRLNQTVEIQLKEEGPEITELNDQLVSLGYQVEMV